MKILGTKTISINGENKQVSIGLLNNFGELVQTINLHKFVVDSLPPEEKEFLLHKTPGYFKDMQSNSGLTFGVKLGNKLIAKSIVSLPQNDDEDNGVKGLRLKIPNDEMAVFESDTVHPDYQGHGLAQLMHVHRKKCAWELGRKHLLAQIHFKNIKNSHIYTKRGMVLTDALLYPDDNAPIFYFHQKLGHEKEMKFYPGISKTIPLDAPFEDFVGAVKNGMRGVQTVENAIVFKKEMSHNNVNVMKGFGDAAKSLSL
jgi:GNAT superfamily N-acetyltransferase